MNADTCIQEFQITNFSIDSVSFPNDILISCEDDPNPDALDGIVNPAFDTIDEDWPHINGLDVNSGLCNLLVSYTDHESTYCGGFQE